MIKTVILFVVAAALFVRTKVTELFVLLGLASPRPPTLKRWTVDRAFLFCEPNDTPLEPSEPDFIDVRRHYDIDFEEDDVLDQLAALVPSTWPTWRCELRYLKGTLKRRVVIRPGESYSTNELSSMRSTRFSPNARIVRAWMISNGGKRVDLTDRLCKYVINPDRKLHPLDVFPFDLEDELIEYFGTLFVETVSATGRVERHEFQFADVDANLVTLR